jgi:predicted nucleic acid-binding protein
MRIYLDVCCFNRPFDDQRQLRVRLEAEAKLVIQEKIRAGELELAWSYMMDFENEANPFAERTSSIASWRALAKSDISESVDILTRARSLSQKGVRSMDSLHLACAIELRCDVFVSTDDGILRKNSVVKEIAILNPIDYATNL